MRSKKNRFFAQLGNAIVEFALIAPIVILLTLGTIELGRYAYFAILVSSAAQAGASYGSKDGGTAYDTSGMETAVSLAASPNPIATITASPVPTVEWGCWDTVNATFSASDPFPAATSSSTGRGACTAGTPVPYVSVSAKGTLKPLFHLPFVNANGITITKTVLRRVQCQIGAGNACQTPAP